MISVERVVWNPVTSSFGVSGLEEFKHSVDGWLRTEEPQAVK
jgi:hypothetical protein